MEKLSVEKVPPLYSRVYETIREAIVNGAFSPGEQIVETELAHRLSVSRTPVRDALRQLAKDGLIVQTDGHATVFAPTVSDIAEIYASRAALEGLAAAIATQNALSDLPEELERILEKAIQANENGDVDRVVNLNTKFHSKVIRASRNRLLIQTIEGMHLRTMQSRQLSLCNPEHRSISLKEHRQIVEEIGKGNSEGMQKLVSHHILKAGCRVVQHMGVPKEPSATISYLWRCVEENGLISMLFPS